MRITYASLPSVDSCESNRYLSAPLATGYLAAYSRSIRGAKDAHTILATDQLAGLSPVEVTSSILATDPQLVALSVNNWNRDFVMEVTRSLGEVDPKLPIVLGGPEVAFDPAKALQESSAWWVCTGEGEIPFVTLLDRLEGNSDDILAVPGMVSRIETVDQYITAPPLVNLLDDIPSPYTIGIFTPQLGSSVDLETMRGCPFRCNFCLYGKNYNHLRYFSRDRVWADLALLVNSEAASIYIIDPTFNFPIERCLEICRMLKELNVQRRKKIFVEVKAEYIDECMADAFVEAGIAAVEVGLQSTNPTALELMGRSFDPVKFTKGMRLLREREIWANIGVIAGLPGDSIGQFRDTLHFISDQALGRLLIYPLQVFPGSDFHRDAEKLGLRYEPAPSYQVTQTPLISTSELREIITLIPDLIEEMNQPYVREMSRMVLDRLRLIQDSSMRNTGMSGTTDQNWGG
jgi:radical SAM superfamily enzyme YgiQ (UPF0313 family)